MYGLNAFSQNNKTGATISLGIGGKFTIGQASVCSANMTNAVGVQIVMAMGTLASTNAYGLQLVSSRTGSTCTNFYQVYMDTGSIGIASGATNKYGIYQADTDATNVFGSKVTMRQLNIPYNVATATTSRGTGAPSGGVDGDIYFQYTP
jgi:hypothetical protein